MSSKKYPPPDYKSGELITGIDRSFPRSIYRYHGMNGWETKVKFELLAYGGRVYSTIKDCVQYFPAKVAPEYRVATREELIESGVVPKSVDFIIGD